MPGSAVPYRRRLSTFDDAAQVQARVQRIAAAVQATVDALTSVAWDRLSIEVAVVLYCISVVIGGLLWYCNIVCDSFAVS